MSLIFSNDLRSAYITEVVDAFERLRPSSYLGRTALQKLVYFSKAIGVPIPCSFEIYNFGPYSEEVTRSVTGLLADDALEDVSYTGAYSSYKIGINSKDFSQEYLDEVRQSRLAIEAIVKVLGPSKPETLELVATLHFVNARQKGASRKQPSKESVVEEFRCIKGNKFSSEDINLWYSWLDSAGLL